MANTTIAETSDFDVAEKYDTLVKQSLAGNSAYIRAKETVLDLVAQGAIDDSQKAEILSNILGSVVNNITSSSMSTAVQWANSEKEFVLKKLELEKQIDILITENSLKSSQQAQIDNTARLAKIESRRMYGVGTFDVDGNVSSLTDTGKLYQDQLLAEAQTAQITSETTKVTHEISRLTAETALVGKQEAKMDKEILKTAEEIALTTQKLNESYAAVHKIVADTYVNFGSYTYTGLDTNGVDAVTSNHGVGHVTLSATQQTIAEEQAKGYTYNAWANALTGSASMLGTAIAADYAEFTDPLQPGYQLLQNVLNTASKLKDATTPT